MKFGYRLIVSPELADDAEALRYVMELSAQSEAVKQYGARFVSAEWSAVQVLPMFDEMGEYRDNMKGALIRGNVTLKDEQEQ